MVRRLPAGLVEVLPGHADLMSTPRQYVSAVDTADYQHRAEAEEQTMASRLVEAEQARIAAFLEARLGELAGQMGRDVATAKAEVDAQLERAPLGLDEPSGWFADLSDNKTLPSYPWQPFLQLVSGCYPLPLWFSTEADCEDFIRTDILGQTMLEASLCTF
jgi:hypothetical protein